MDSKADKWQVLQGRTRESPLTQTWGELKKLELSGAVLAFLAGSQYMYVVGQSPNSLRRDMETGAFLDLFGLSTLLSKTWNAATVAESVVGHLLDSFLSGSHGEEWRPGLLLSGAS